MKEAIERIKEFLIEDQFRFTEYLTIEDNCDGDGDAEIYEKENIVRSWIQGNNITFLAAYYVLYQQDECACSGLIMRPIVALLEKLTGNEEEDTDRLIEFKSISHLFAAFHLLPDYLIEKMFLDALHGVSYLWSYTDILFLCKQNQVSLLKDSIKNLGIPFYMNPHEVYDFIDSRIFLDQISNSSLMDLPLFISGMDKSPPFIRDYFTKRLRDGYKNPYIRLLFNSSIYGEEKYKEYRDLMMTYEDSIFTKL